MDEPVQPPSEQPKRFFDIASPKNFRPSATSRPLIVGHHPEQPDPMVTTTSEQPKPISVTDAAEPKEDIQEPVSPPLAPPEVETAPIASDPVTQTPETMMQEEYAEIEHELPSGEASESVDLSQSADVTALPDAATSGTVSQAVVVHHNHHPHPIGKKIVTIAIVVVVLLILGDGLLDANIWKPTHKFPHTHFFNK